MAGDAVFLGFIEGVVGDGIVAIEQTKADIVLLQSGGEAEAKEGNIIASDVIEAVEFQTG